MEERIHSFAPIIDNNCRVLVLGTVPGIASLQAEQYYGHQRNQFWPIIFALYGIACPTEYQKRTAFLLEKGIALWDVLDSCVRHTSADGDIREPKPNDIAGLLASYPAINVLFFNGKGAANLFKRHIASDVPRSLLTVTLPSTSPAYTIPFADKLIGWKPLLNQLEKTTHIYPNNSV